MKRYAKFAMLAVVLVMGAYAGHFYATAENAAVNCPEVQQCLADGYTMDTCVAQPIYYFAQPDGPYNWGQVNIVMRAAGKAPIHATCYINAKEKRNGGLVFWETHNQVVTPIR